MPFATSILVPTDFSSKSETAIRYACEIAASTGAEIHFLNVIEEPYDFATRANDILKAKKKEQADKLQELIHDLHSVDDFRHIRMVGMIKVGLTLPTILRTSEEGEFSLITIALGGKADFKKVMYGSITNSILIDSKIPVLAISKHIDYRRLRRLIFATDFRTHDIKNIKQMKKFSIDLGVKLDIVHVLDETDKRLPEIVELFVQKLREKLKNNQIEINYHENREFIEGITEYINSDKNSILVITRYRKKFLEWLFANSTARSVAQIAEVPLLMLPTDK